MWRRTRAPIRSAVSDQVLLTHSSSFSIPVGICGTARLMAAKSGRSGISSARKTGIGLHASSARALNDSFDILSSSRPRANSRNEQGLCDQSIVMRIRFWAKALSWSLSQWLWSQLNRKAKSKWPPSNSIHSLCSLSRAAPTAGSQAQPHGTALTSHSPQTPAARRWLTAKNRSDHTMSIITLTHCPLSTADRL